MQSDLEVNNKGHLIQLEGVVVSTNTSEKYKD